MFTTDMADEVTNNRVTSYDRHSRTWKRFDTTQPYFQLIEQQSVGGHLEQVVVFISDPYELRRLVNAARSLGSEKIGRVTISTPGEINRSDSWSHDTLLAMFFAFNRDSRQSGMVYVTSGGTYGIATENELPKFCKEIVYQDLEYPLNLFDDYFETGLK